MLFKKSILVKNHCSTSPLSHNSLVLGHRIYLSYPASSLYSRYLWLAMQHVIGEGRQKKERVRRRKKESDEDNREGGTSRRSVEEYSKLYLHRTVKLLNIEIYNHHFTYMLKPAF